MTTLFYEDFAIGELHSEENLNFSYLDKWASRKSAFPISVTMPTKTSSYGPDKIQPWLANLMPESHLSEIGQRLKVSPQDIVGVLAHLGRDTAGAISVGAPRKSGSTSVTPIPDEATLEKIINELPEKPFLIGTEGVSMSLAGVQDKLPVYMLDDGMLGVPTEGTPSTHILKPDALKTRLPASVQNEAFCMRLARHCGLDVANVTTGVAGSRSYLLVERYDRIRDGKGFVRRIHQEDFCQVLGYFPAQKYERSRFGGRNGPTLVDMFKAVEEFISAGEREKFLDAVIFNVLICNTDAHAKNYSILIGQGGSARLAPLYDLMCASIYKNVDQSLAQSIAGKTNANELHAADWKELATSVSLSPAKTLRRVQSLAESVLEHAEMVANEIAETQVGCHDLLSRVSYEVQKRAKRILRQLDEAN
ncbi:MULTISPECIES: type II toxin-antitoxin system HipA family toxin [unclassified Ochrobactrum]|uniref:type II toxin-antitoxin system HipA family toxin n=1 Tax=unclassified Ochrobactrum TaxID=239106 RepID=UPI0030A78908